MSTQPSEPKAGFRQDAFIVRVWRGAGEDGWRCRLIHAETGQHLPCNGVDQVGEQIEIWLRGMGQRSVKGLR